MLKISGCGTNVYYCLDSPTPSGSTKLESGRRLLKILEAFCWALPDFDKKDSRKVSTIEWQVPVM
jgi:hypothetical protein